MTGEKKIDMVEKKRKKFYLQINFHIYFNYKKRIIF